METRNVSGYDIFVSILNKKDRQSNHISTLHAVLAASFSAVGPREKSGTRGLEKF
jgi:hypothetical protein